jgi:hypothetical protein
VVKIGVFGYGDTFATACGHFATVRGHHYAKIIIIKIILKHKPIYV